MPSSKRPGPGPGLGPGLITHSRGRGWGRGRGRGRVYDQGYINIDRFFKNIIYNKNLYYYLCHEFQFKITFLLDLSILMQLCVIKPGPGRLLMPSPEPIEKLILPEDV